jgi:hypothetical protein
MGLCHLTVSVILLASRDGILASVDGIVAPRGRALITPG